MRCNRFQVALAIAVVAVLALATPASAGSFTFDFEDPNGTGVNFADAISLNTVGAARDSAGSPIGFTQQSAPAAGNVSPVTLGAGGLAFSISSTDVVALGVPHNTTSTGTDVSIIARFEGITGMDAKWENIGVGWGTSTTTGAYPAFTGARLVMSATLEAQALTSNSGGGNLYSTPSVLHSLPDQDITVIQDNAPGGYSFPVFTATFDGTTNQLGDALGVLNNPVASFGYVTFGGGGNGFTGTLTSITYTGDNLVTPTVVPEPSTLLIWSLGLLGLIGWRRKRAA